MESELKTSADELNRMIHSKATELDPNISDDDKKDPDIEFGSMNDRYQSQVTDNLSGEVGIVLYNSIPESFRPVNYVERIMRKSKVDGDLTLYSETLNSVLVNMHNSLIALTARVSSLEAQVANHEQRLSYFEIPQ